MPGDTRARVYDGGAQAAHESLNLKRILTHNQRRHFPQNGRQARTHISLTQAEAAVVGVNPNDRPVVVGFDNGGSQTLYPHLAVQPPSMGNAAPVMKELSSAAR